MLRPIQIASRSNPFLPNFLSPGVGVRTLSLSNLPAGGSGEILGAGKALSPTCAFALEGCSNAASTQKTPLPYIAP